MNSPNMFRKKSISDELFLHFFFESSESDRFFQLPGELIQRHFSGAQYSRAEQRRHLPVLNVTSDGKGDFTPSELARTVRQKAIAHPTP